MTVVYDTGSAFTLTATNTVITAPAIITTDTDELIIAFMFGGDNTSVTGFSSGSPPNGSGTQSAALAQPAKDTWIEVADSNTTTGADTTNSFAHAIKTIGSGSTGIFSVTAAASALHGMILGAFKFVTEPQIATAGTRVFYVVYPASETRVPQGLDIYNGWPGVSVSRGDYITPSFNGTFNFPTNITGLSPSTSYKIAFVWTDGEYWSSVVEASFSTLASAGYSIPVLSAATMFNVTDTTGYARVTITIT